MDSRFNGNRERTEWRIPPGYEVVLVERRAPRAKRRPEERTLQSEALAFKKEALAQLRPFGVLLWQEMKKMVGLG